MAYEVSLEVFEGPIDLLLHLITRQRVDIYEVSLATITEEYVAAVAAMEDLDLESATAFLVVAATLLELKSSRLLPARSWDEDAGRLLEERDLLLARLVECATYREAGGWIAGLLRAGEGYHSRQVALETPFLDVAPDLLADRTPLDFAQAAAGLLAPAPVVELDLSHLAPIRASVRDAIVAVASRLAADRDATLEELCGTNASRIEVVVRFLALLELYKAGAIDLSQTDRWGQIRASWTGDVDPAEVVEDAEEYTVERERAR